MKKETKIKPVKGSLGALQVENERYVQKMYI